MNSLSSQIFTPPRSLHPVSQPVIQEESAAFATSTPSQEARAHGDYNLSQEYASTLRRVLDGGANAKTTLPIDPESTFGQWWSQLERAFESFDVAQWIRDKGINGESIKLNPGSGQLSYSLRYALDPKQTIHTVGLDDRLWASISGPILEAARVLSAGDPNVTFAPPTNGFNPAHAPYQLVGRFYNEPPEQTQNAMRDREQELTRNKGFTPLDPITSADLIAARSEQALQVQQASLGDSRDKRHIIENLQTVLSDLGPGDVTAQQIQDKLKQSVVQLSNDQTLATGMQQKTSLLQLLEDYGWNIPTNQEELANLIKVLTAPALNPPVNGNLGGALAWPIPLDQDSQTQLNSDVSAGKFGNLVLSPFGTVLDYLLNGRSVTADEQREPRRLIDQLINSPRGKALGEAIQKTFAERGVKGSAPDWLLAALNTVPGDQTKAKVPGVIEGYQLTSVDNVNKWRWEIVKGLADHLVSTGKASSPDHAAIQAHLLLASQAPQFLVKGIPDQVGVGTHSWVSFVTAVARIEAKAPGATATMSYAEIMLEADNGPITEGDREVEFSAQNEAIKAWAVTNGMAYPETPSAVTQVRSMFSAQVNELKEASETHIGELPRTKDIALQQLKKALPDMDPKLFEEKSISLRPGNDRYPGPYSILDMFIDGRALVDVPDSRGHLGEVEHAFVRGASFGLINPPKDGRPAKWVSSSKDINIGDVLEKIKDLPRPQVAFNEKMEAYSKAVKKTTSALIKYLISKMPPEDRLNLMVGEFKISKETEYYKDGYSYPAAEGVVLVRTLRDGWYTTYEVDRIRGTITNRPRTYEEYPPIETRLYGSKAGKRYDQIKPVGQYPVGITDENKVTQGTLDSFGSARSQYIADAVVADIDLPAIEKFARGQTTFDTEVPLADKVKEIALNLIPFRSAVKNFITGNIEAGIVDLGFDIFGFVVGAGTAAKGASTLAKGASAFSKIIQTSKIIGRAAIGALNPLDGIDDVARGVVTLGRKATTATYRGVQHLRGSYRSVNLLELAKKPDIAQGTFKAAQSASNNRTFAQLDKTTQRWHAYDPRTGQAYGKALDNFTADIPTPNKPSNLGAIKKEPSFIGNPTSPGAIAEPMKPYLEKLRHNIEAAKTPEELRYFNNGYKSGIADDIPGYRQDMSTNELIELASNPNLSSDEIGVLAREVKKSMISDAQHFSSLLFKDVNGPGVKFTPASQVHFLAHVDITSKGECAGLANLTALAVEQNKQDLLMQNLYRVLARPTEPQSRVIH